MRCHLCGQELKNEDGKWTNVVFACRPCFDKPRHRYYYLYRPPGTGCQKDGFINRERWMPAELIPDTGQRALGWVDYPFRLDLEDVWKWELQPANMYDRKLYWEWRESEMR